MVKSPLNYTGGKYKLLQYILPKLDEPIVDIFAGGGNVGANTNHDVWFNDTQTQVIDLFKWMYWTELQTQLGVLEDEIESRKLDRVNKSVYLKLREDYNADPSERLFYLLVAHSFGNQIRFNKKGEFNLPFGKRTFNDRMKSNYIDFVTRLKSKNCKFTELDFADIDTDWLIYADPPYSNGVASYNEMGWNDDERLFDYLQDKRFVMSNAFKNNGVTNKSLMVWAKQFNYEILPIDYKGSNYQRKNRGETVEVLIWKL